MSVSKEMLLTWLVSSAAACVFAQNTATIAGTVSDSDGVALGKAAIQATNTATKTVFKATASDNGGYTLAQLPAGSYDLLATAPGMPPYQQQDVVVQASQTLRLDIRVQDFGFNTLGDGREFFANLIARHQTPQGPTPRDANGHPDLSGVWLGSLPTLGDAEPLPWARDLMKQRADVNYKGSPQSLCLPPGITVFGVTFPYRIVQTPTILVMIAEQEVPHYRQIFLDGRVHPKNLEPTWMGHSVGHWEQDTLVVDSAGFNDKTWLDGRGRPHTERMHITERWRRPDLGHLQVEFTIDDPGAYVKPWTITKASDLAALGDEVHEFICNENNKDAGHMVGK